MSDFGFMELTLSRARYEGDRNVPWGKVTLRGVCVQAVFVRDQKGYRDTVVQCVSGDEMVVMESYAEVMKLWKEALT